MKDEEIYFSIVIDMSTMISRGLPFPQVYNLRLHTEDTYKTIFQNRLPQLIVVPSKEAIDIYIDIYHQLKPSIATQVLLTRMIQIDYIPYINLEISQDFERREINQ